MARRICTLSLLTAVCIVLGWVESMLPLNFIAPAVKLGLANSVCLLLIIKGDIKGAFLVNVTRIILSALLFSTPFSLFFSLSAGFVSLTVMVLISKLKLFSVIYFSIMGAVVHNAVQIFVAFLIFGSAVFWYFPILLLSAVISGALIGFLCQIISKKIKVK